MSDSGGQYPEGWAPSGLPPSRGGQQGSRARWFTGLGVVAVVVIIGAAFLFIGQGAESGSAQAAQSPAQPTNAVGQRPGTPAVIVSADDTGPITIITDEPTCGVWDNVQTSVAVARNGGWNERDPWVPAATWTPERRANFEAMADALRSGANTAVPLAGETTHRVMRELYETFIAYGRAYSDGMPNYQPMSEYLARTSLAALDSITNICGAVRSKVASVQQPGLPTLAPPTTPPVVGDPANPQRLLTQPNSVCPRWTQAEEAVLSETQAWSALDPNVGVGQLDKEQVLIYDDAAQAFTAHAAAMDTAGRDSGNPVVEDFAALGALYFRAYANAVPSIWTGDHDMADVGFSIDKLVSAACLALG